MEKKIGRNPTVVCARGDDHPLQRDSVDPVLDHEGLAAFFDRANDMHQRGVAKPG